MVVSAAVAVVAVAAAAVATAVVVVAIVFVPIVIVVVVVVVVVVETTSPTVVADRIVDDRDRVIGNGSRCGCGPIAIVTIGNNRIEKTRAIQQVAIIAHFVVIVGYDVLWTNDSHRACVALSSSCSRVCWSSCAQPFHHVYNRRPYRPPRHPYSVGDVMIASVGHARCRLRSNVRIVFVIISATIFVCAII